MDAIVPVAEVQQVNDGVVLGDEQRVAVPDRHQPVDEAQGSVEHHFLAILDAPGPKKRKPHSEGPLFKAMQAYLAKSVGEGHSYRQSQGMWKQSAEREAIVGKMSATEHKRRRYD